MACLGQHRTPVVENVGAVASQRLMTRCSEAQAIQKRFFVDSSRALRCSSAIIGGEQRDRMVYRRDKSCKLKSLMRITKHRQDDHLFDHIGS